MGVNPFPFHLTPITNLGAYPKSLFGDSNTIECDFMFRTKESSPLYPELAPTITQQEKTNVDLEKENNLEHQD